MHKKRILVMCSLDPQSDPRPNRMIHWLKSRYDLTVIGGAHIQLEGVRSFALFQTDKEYGDSSFAKLKMIGEKYFFYLFRYSFFLLFKQYEEILWGKFNRMRTICEEISKEDFDLIISHEITLMPLAFDIKGNKETKVMLDAKEFYPRNFDDSLRWRLVTKPLNEFLCEKYLHLCDKIITVSDGLAQEYANEYGVQSEVIMSLPISYALEPVRNDNEPIKIIYHGYANSSRKTELMIELMDFVDERFTLDLMLANSNTDKYWHKINNLAKTRDNVRVIPPVAMHEIVSFTNSYDIGLFLCPPTNFNLKYALPNKLFEFIQARLAVAIGPSIEMKKIISEYDCGIASEGFEPNSLAKELNLLTLEELAYYKQQAHEAAQVLNAGTNKILVDRIVSSLLLTERKNI